jgi:folate-binding protein YgfZ
MTQSAQSDVIFSPTTDLPTQLTALLQGSALAPLDGAGWIRVTGEDRVRWLNGMVTNSIQQLKAGEGNYNFLLNVQGRIQGDAYIFAEPDALLLETASAQIPNLLPLLDKFIIMDDVELANVSDAQSGLLVAGPQAASLLARIGIAVEDLPSLSRRNMAWNSAEVIVVHAYGPLVPRYELWTDKANSAALHHSLVEASVVQCEPQSLEWLRILEGTPLYGIDIRDRELPQETGQDRALHFAKGCYLGQEIVERIRSRGNVHRAFTGLRLDGELPVAGSKLEADGKEIGEFTSVAAIPSAGDGRVEQLALGYVRREILDRGVPLNYSGGMATPISLPFFGR